MMNATLRALKMGMLALVLCAFATRAIAHEVDMYLEIKDEKGKITKVPVDKDGTFQSPPLTAGTYTCVCSWSFGASNSSSVGSGSGASGRGISSPTGGSADRSLNFTKISMSYEIQSPRDIATGQASGRESPSGLASGKRMHKPMLITKEVDKSSPLLYRADCGSIVIDTDGETLTGTVACKNAQGKTVAMDDWEAPVK